MRRILTLNAGSSSLKAAVFDDSLRPLARAAVERLNTPRATLTSAGGRATPLGGDAPLHAALAALLPALDLTPGDARLAAVGHRVVHGGDMTASSVWNGDVDAAVAAATPLAPLHNPANVAAHAAAVRLFPDAPHVAVFDTAFHAASVPAAARALALPRAWPPAWRRRVGFHGTSYRGVVAALGRVLGCGEAGVAAVAFHLGAGASACALSGGASIETSMGATPTDGLVSATRCGAADPGLLALRAAALAEGGASAAAVAADLATLNTRAGLLGLSGVSGDVRDVVAAADGGDGDAALALAAYAHRARSYLGAYLLHLRAAGTPAAAIAFTGGVGEHSPRVRAAVVAGLDGGGGPRISLCPAANAAAIGPAAPVRIEAPDSEVAVVVVPCDEEATIAGDALACVA
jgi:acetate kinase